MARKFVIDTGANAKKSSSKPVVVVEEAAAPTVAVLSPPKIESASLKTFSPCPATPVEDAACKLRAWFIARMFEALREGRRLLLMPAAAESKKSVSMTDSDG